MPAFGRVTLTLYISQSTVYVVELSAHAFLDRDFIHERSRLFLSVGASHLDRRGFPIVDYFGLMMDHTLIRDYCCGYGKVTVIGLCPRVTSRQGTQEESLCCVRLSCAGSAVSLDRYHRYKPLLRSRLKETNISDPAVVFSFLFHFDTALEKA